MFRIPPLALRSESLAVIILLTALTAVTPLSIDMPSAGITYAGGGAERASRSGTAIGRRVPCGIRLRATHCGAALRQVWTTPHPPDWPHRISNSERGSISRDQSRNLTSDKVIPRHRRMCSPGCCAGDCGRRPRRPSCTACYVDRHGGHGVCAGAGTIYWCIGAGIYKLARHFLDAYGNSGRVAAGRLAFPEGNPSDR